MDVVDEAGNHLPEKTVHFYEVVDQHPPLPEWAKKGKFGIGSSLQVNPVYPISIRV